MAEQTEEKSKAHKKRRRDRETKTHPFYRIDTFDVFKQEKVILQKCFP